jgi:hypothetical protein
VGKLTPKTGNTADHQTNNVKPTLPNDWSDILDQVREYQLDNGLKLLTLKKKGLGSVVFITQVVLRLIRPADRG